MRAELLTSSRSLLIHKSLTDAEQGNNPMPAYFYCARNASEPERADSEHIMRCIAKQVSYLHQSVLLPTLRAYEKRVESGDLHSQLVLRSSVELIINLVNTRPLTTIIIDALDECNAASQNSILESLSQILEHSTGLVKIFVSSRDDQALCCGLAEYSDLEISATQNQGDISAFVHYELENMIRSKRLLYGRVPEDLKGRILEVICEKAQGM